jgi:hypothetical protein
MRIKKSKASSDQPRKQAMNVFRCTEDSLRKWPRNSICVDEMLFCAAEVLRMLTQGELAGGTGLIT